MPKPEIDSEDALGTGTSLVKIVSEVLEEVDPELDAAQDDLAVTINPNQLKRSASFLNSDQSKFSNHVMIIQNSTSAILVGIKNNNPSTQNQMQRDVEYGKSF